MTFHEKGKKQLIAQKKKRDLMNDKFPEIRNI